MIHQPKSLSSLVCDKIVQSLAYHLCKDQSLRLSIDLTNQVMNQAIRVLSFEGSIPCKIWKLAHCTEVSVQSPISAKNIQILCTLWRKTLTTLSISDGDFQRAIFVGDAFEKLYTLKIERPENLCKAQLLNLCQLLPNHLEECTIAYCNDLDNDVLKTLLEKCPHLQLLNIAGCKQVSAITSPVTNVRSLDISGTQINDQVLFDIKKEYLVYLNCSHTSISNIGLKSIEMSCGKTLKGLDIQYCPYITHLGDGFTNLVMLGTYKTSIPISSCPDIVLSLPNGDGKQLFYMAVVNEDEHLVDDIFERILCNEMKHIIEIQDTDGNTFLHWACYKDRNDVARKLIGKMDPKTFGLQGSFGKTALYWAIANNLHEVALLLIDNMESHELAVQDTNGDTVLHRACRGAQGDLALKLINKMDLKILGLQGKSSKTALHRAIQKHLYEVANKLVEKMDKDSIRLVDSKNRTALSLAIDHQQEELELFITMTLL